MFLVRDGVELIKIDQTKLSCYKTKTKFVQIQSDQFHSGSFQSCQFHSDSLQSDQF